MLSKNQLNHEDSPENPLQTISPDKMQLLTTQELQQKHLDLLNAASSDNTRRTYRSAIRHFLEWGGRLPADESVIIRYLLIHSELQNPRTLALRLTALSQWHIQQGFTDPTMTVTVRKTLVGIQRTYGKPPKKAKALSLDEITRIAECLSEKTDLSSKRDNALLQMAFFGAFRRSEIVVLEFHHIRWEAEGMVITLPRSKTDQSGQGIVKAIPFGAGVCCPCTALKIWLNAANICQGPLFRPINQWQSISPKSLHESSVNTILDKCAEMVALNNAEHLSSHSLRRGMATSAYRAGANFQDIKRQGGWRHDGTVQGYIEEASQFESNAAGKLLNKKPQ